MLSDTLLEDVLAPAMEAISQYGYAEDTYDQETFNTIFDALLQLRLVVAKLDCSVAGEMKLPTNPKKVLRDYMEWMDTEDFKALLPRVEAWMEDSHIAA